MLKNAHIQSMVAALMRAPAGTIPLSVAKVWGPGGALPSDRP